MSDVRFTSEIDVQLLDCSFSDERVCVAARTSTAGADANPEATDGLIKSLMRNRHGSPFEHMNATWRVTAPIFVWREHHRHRIASYNEESCRYKVLEPLFYIPPFGRHLQQVGKPMEYRTQPGTREQYRFLVDDMREDCEQAYARYLRRMEQGIMREVARMTLPLNIMSTCVVTMNARALMNFLSLRVRDDKAAYPSKPQYEIQLVAQQYSMDFRDAAPLTYAAFIANGRVAP